MGFITAPDKFMPVIRSAPPDTEKGVIWNVRDFCGFRDKQRFNRLSIEQLEFLVNLTSSHFAKIGPPSTGWSGDTNQWDAADLVRQIISWMSADASEAARKALTQLSMAPAAQSYHDDVKHAMAQQQIRLIDERFRQPTYKQAIEALRNGCPANVADLRALVIAHFIDLGAELRGANIDLYKRFWNEGEYGRVVSPKGEESCRDALVELLRARLSPLGVRVEPEGHMVADKRADIVALAPNIKLVIELKRDYHPDVWTAIRDQLDRFYTRDPEAQGFGIYGVFWFGSKRSRRIVSPPDGRPSPRTAREMQRRLANLMPRETRERVETLVLDVSPPISGSRGKRQGTGRKRTTGPKRSGTSSQRAVRRRAH